MNYHFNYLDNRCNDFINSLVNDTNFDLDTFNKWAHEHNVEFKSNPSAFIRSVFKEELERGSFKKQVRSAITYYPSMQPLFNAMHDKGFVVKNDDCLYIDILERNILHQQILTLDELIKLNHTIIDYIAKNITKPSSSIFIRYLKNSKTLKKKSIDYESIQIEYETLNAQWEQMTKELIAEEDKRVMSDEEYIDYLKKEGASDERG